MDIWLVVGRSLESASPLLELLLVVAGGIQHKFDFRVDVAGFPSGIYYNFILTYILQLSELPRHKVLIVNLDS